MRKLDRVDICTQLKINLQLAERLDPTSKQRSIDWLFSALLRQGYKHHVLSAKLEKRGSNGQFWLLRQLAPDHALIALNAKLEQHIKGFENETHKNIADKGGSANY